MKQADSPLYTRKNRPPEVYQGDGELIPSLRSDVAFEVRSLSGGRRTLISPPSEPRPYTGCVWHWPIQPTRNRTRPFTLPECQGLNPRRRRWRWRGNPCRTRQKPGCCAHRQSCADQGFCLASDMTAAVLVALLKRQSTDGDSQPLNRATNFPCPFHAPTDKKTQSLKPRKPRRVMSSHRSGGLRRRALCAAFPCPASASGEGPFQLRRERDAE